MSRFISLILAGVISICDAGLTTAELAAAIPETGDSLGERAWKKTAPHSYYGHKLLFINQLVINAGWWSSQHNSIKLPNR